MTTSHDIFSVFGIELEYMIVNRDTLEILPLSEVLFKEKTGDFNGRYEAGEITWTNELTAHVIELKNTAPKTSFKGLHTAFHANIKDLNKMLEPHNAMLLPTSAHPLMDPKTQTVLWRHENREIYELYDQVFNCKQHGWSNEQSMHINLPFANDAEFERLHAAVRMVLPIIPALAASSPILEGEITPYRDARLWAYVNQNKNLPAIAGRIIPEPVFNKLNYTQQIFNPIQAAIKPYDKQKIMDKHRLNARGAIARFDRGSIEIRVTDIQECPKADIAIAELIIAVIKGLANEKSCNINRQKSWHTDDLRVIMTQTKYAAEQAIITDSNYLHCLGLHVTKVSAQDLWQHLLDNHKSKISKESQATLSSILNYGSLSSRILEKVGKMPTSQSIYYTYSDLADCLAANILYI